MKAEEVLRKYAAGERDFRKENLRGQSLQGQDLSGADFSEADIRGANFKNAILTGTKFCNAVAGLQKRWVFLLLLVSWITSGVSGMASLLGGALVGLSSDFNSVDNQVSGWAAFIILIIVYSVILRQGIRSGVAIAIAGSSLVVIVVVTANAIGIASAIVSATASTFVSASATAIATASTFVSTSASTFVSAIASIITIGIAIATAFAFAFAFAFRFTGLVAIAVTIAVAVALALLGAYLGWRALKGDPRDAWIRTIAIAFAATGGTSFYNADLTDADFTGATLKSTDLRKATLTRTCWQDTIKLDRTRPGKTILADTAVRELLVTGNGYNKSYVDANLRGANLKGANLNKANLKLADLSEATLEEANLEWANLTEAQAVGTDFTHAYFTGACLEAWNIDSTTTLTNIDCQYVFLLENSNPQGSRERRPSSDDFQAGEFTKLFQEVLNTVDLIFQNGVDWKAFVTAFKKVQVENEDTELAIQSIENKGDGVVVVKVSVPPDTNKEKIHSDFKQKYELVLQELEKYKAELKAKDEQIIEIYREQSENLMKIIEPLVSRPIKNIFDVTAKAESDMSDNSRNFNIDNLDIDQSQANNPNNFNVFNDNARQINTNNFTSEETQSLADAAAEIQQLLNQLSQTNPTSNEIEKLTVVAKAAEKIKNNPTLKNKVINALKAGGVEAFKEAIDHPLVNILMATIDGWTEV
ncbi:MULTISPECIES: pentapeptide repeat-containing protein [unclassified Moorena]|uniref:pentapeptide repeat-containing protein n=1 Tax=unclassified Moorena TaxID=2683338 RepID=UPI0013FF7B7D|nr:MULTISPECIES: pentapeptide repeat-containing protein [unclassified Moorena]NEO16269.1 pentapeptide repeat-containing protein [Moorena sp. SIO3E8]NEQ02790.1 pentapeptide repeat-containing protein [Moorena sp. SIO3F7]